MMTSHTLYNQQVENENNETCFSPASAVTPDTPASSVVDSLAESFSRRLHVMDNPPPENPRMEDVEKIAASEMNKLSTESREQILYDLHGISEKMPEETPEFLRRKLQDLENSLQNIEDSDKEAYNLALSIDPVFVKNQEFRLKFLRADLFDASGAATRFSKHFQAKLELFGRALLCKDITQDDLQDEEGTLECIYSGWLQDLPIRDISGRLVSFMFQKAKDPKWTTEAKCRAIWYRRMLNSMDIETQRNGEVLVIFNSEQELDRNSVWKAGRLAACLPLRFVAFHMCYLPEYYEKQGPALSLGRLAMESYQRHRHRAHTGSIRELKYTLQTFGIPMTALLMDDSGAVPVAYNHECMLKQRMMERQRAAAAGTVTNIDASFQHQQIYSHIKTPGKHDVLMGRGRSCQEHAGNVRFRYLIEQNLDRYDATPKHLKMQIALEILEDIHQIGGRFLTPCDGGWEEIDEVAAREKVSSCFRSFRKVKGHGKKNTASPTVHCIAKRQAEQADFALCDKERRMF
ncbi:hypothetical protein IV203_036038 [Nitzschia inconspicua]|uniref:DUF6824 domain-containing protein n=1 Tax=Nitzschia inconspicua TaxID=303405 RepID=A0A9K3LFQ2_9STRA|nr:hypothetical protein IV203_036038 [Nitzschia inconspicua]